MEKQKECGDSRGFRSTVGTVLVLFCACVSLWSVDIKKKLEAYWILYKCVVLLILVLTFLLFI